MNNTQPEQQDDTIKDIAWPGTPEEQASWQGIARCLQEMPQEEALAYLDGLARRLLSPETYEKVKLDE